MSTIVALAMIAQPGGWSYGGFAAEPAPPPARSWAHEKAAADPPPFRPQVESNIYLEPAPPPPPMVPSPPEAETPAPQASKAVPPRAAGPVAYELADVTGVTWSHADPDHLRKWVAERNRTLQRPPPVIYRGVPPPLPPFYALPASCTPAGG